MEEKYINQIFRFKPNSLKRKATYSVVLEANVTNTTIFPIGNDTFYNDKSVFTSSTSIGRHIYYLSYNAK